MTYSTTFAAMKSDPVYRNVAFTLDSASGKYFPLYYFMDQVWETGVDGVTAVPIRRKLFDRYAEVRDGLGDKAKKAHDKHIAEYKKKRAQGQIIAILTEDEIAHKLTVKEMPRRLDMESYYGPFGTLYGGICYGVALRWLEVRAQNRTLSLIDADVKGLPKDFPKILFCDRVSSLVLEYFEAQKVGAATEVTFNERFRLRTLMSHEVPGVMRRSQFTFISTRHHAMAGLYEGSFYYFLDPNYGCFRFHQDHLERPFVTDLFAAVWEANGLANNVTVQGLSVET